MQVLKESVRQKIVKAARREFKKYGFEKASMRSMATSAGMTVGNLYRYYKDKENLYGAVIEKLSGELQVLIANLPKEPADRLNYLLENFKKLQGNHRAEWLTLFGGSGGTKFEKTTEEIHDILRTTLSDFLVEHNRRPEMCVPVASAIIYGLNTILRFDKGKSSELANDFLDYMMVDITNRVA